jgi:hypothetical protein
VAFLIFILIKDKLKIFIKKEYWIYGATFIASMIPYFIWAYYTFGNILAFTTDYSVRLVGTIPFAWSTILYFQVFGLNIMYFIFIAGMILCLRALLYLDIIIKKSDLDIRIFLLSILLTILGFYIFYIRAVDDRWVFIWLPLMAIICGMILDKLYSWAAEYGNWKWLAALFILALLAYSSYEQFTYAQNTINAKVGTYKDVKLAAEWIKASSQPNEIIMSISYVQTIFYAQREVKSYSTMNVTTIEEYINKSHPSYLIISIYEPHPAWIY